MSIYFTSFATEKIETTCASVPHVDHTASLYRYPTVTRRVRCAYPTGPLRLPDRSATLTMDNRTTPPPASVIQKIEADAIKKTAEILTSAVPDTNKEKALVGAMNSGMEAFRAQMGRNPTYSEMRAMFG